MRFDFVITQYKNFSSLNDWLGPTFQFWEGGWQTRQSKLFLKTFCECDKLIGGLFQNIRMAIKWQHMVIIYVCGHRTVTTELLGNTRQAFMFHRPQVICKKLKQWKQISSKMIMPCKWSTQIRHSSNIQDVSHDFVFSTFGRAFVGRF